MKRFKNILVGVDLSSRERFAVEPPSESNVVAIRQAMWLAKLNSASLQFLYAWDLSKSERGTIADAGEDEMPVLTKANQLLADLVRRAEEEGLTARSEVVFGKSWIELMREVNPGGHDLVVVGTRRKGPLGKIFQGNTALKLLRQCPCPVWVTQTQATPKTQSVLVAHDLRPVGDLAMALGCSMAKLQNARLHIVHAAEYPELESMFPAKVSAHKQQFYRREAEDRIQSQIARAGVSEPVEVACVNDPADVAIMNYVEQHRIELVVMGTVGRSGVSGLVTGNTAERLLPRLPCSLLAVKPPGFETPIVADDG